jgi:hypothetical protein
LVIIVAKEFEEAVKYYNSEEKDASDSDAYTLTIIDKKTTIKEYIYIQRPQVSYGAIAHEGKHIVNKIFSDRGIDLDCYNDEAECYLLGFIVDKIVEYINKK